MIELWGSLYGAGSVLPVARYSSARAMAWYQSMMSIDDTVAP